MQTSLTKSNNEVVPTETSITVLDAIQPFMADDGHKGTFLILRIAGIEQGTALKMVNRKFRSWQNWRTTDEDFHRLDEQIPVLAIRFGGEARVVRTALLDISIIETGISIFKRILRKEPVSSDMWAYAIKMAGLRVPLMGAKEESGSPWERLANSIKNTMSQKELTIRQEIDGTKSITAREITIQPSQEQRQVANEIVEQMLNRAGREN